MKKECKKFIGLVFALTGSMILVACNKAANVEDPDGYTYNTYLSTSPSKWSVLNWETSEQSYIQGFTEMGLYDLIFNENRDGYKIIPEMAASMPVDVSTDIDLSDEERQKYGYLTNIKSGYIWEIELNKNAVWQDGTPITATDYVESMERQLNPKLVNYRADSYYSSSLSLCNAERYFKQGRTTFEPLFSYIDTDTGEFKTSDKFTVNSSNYYINLGAPTPFGDSIFSDSDGAGINFYTVLNNRSSSLSDAAELAAQRITDACAYYLWQYVKTDANDKIWGKVEKPSDVTSEMFTKEGGELSDEQANISIYNFDEHEVLVRKTKDDSSVAEGKREAYSSDALQKDLVTFIRELTRSGYDPSWSWKLPLFGKVYNNDAVSFEDVGIKKVDDYKIRLYLSKKISTLDLKFSLTGNWIVKVDLYDKLTQKTNDKLSQSKYGTASVNNYMSYGPYKLTTFEEGKTIVMSKNDKWYGYSDGNHEDQFQMTSIRTSIIADQNNVKQQFLAGKLDDWELTKDDMATYGNSSRLTTTYESYTQKISFNSDRNALNANSLGSTDKTVLANTNFRKGLSLALDRNSFAANTTAGSKAFTGLLNDLYLTNSETGEMYRDTAQGRSVYGKVYGALGGNPYDSEDPDSFVGTALANNLNGYNFNMATYYVAKGLKEELTAGDSVPHITSGKTIGLEILVYDKERDTTKAMTTFISDSFNRVIEAAVAKLRNDGFPDLSIDFKLDMRQDEDYYNTAQEGKYDMIFSTWGGAATNPYGLMQVYCDTTFASCCEYGFKGKQDKVSISIDSEGDGQLTTKTYHDWFKQLTVDLIEPDPDSDDYEGADDPLYIQEYNDIHNKKLNILAGLEAGILSRFEAVPLVARGTASLTSFKCENGSSTYINLIGYGGIRYLEFKYNNKEWNSLIGGKDWDPTRYEQ